MAAMEQILMAEAELQKCLASMSLDLSEENEELESFASLVKDRPSVDAANEAIRKIFPSATDREKKVPVRQHIYQIYVL
jgi:hypothetical protein